MCGTPCYPYGILQQQNRASRIGGILHTDGSITIYEHVIRMVSTLNTNNFDSL